MCEKVMGMVVSLKMVQPYGNVKCRNVTEIHYKYPSVGGDKIAIESYIHGTGCTYFLKDVLEFEVEPETVMADNF